MTPQPPLGQGPIDPQSAFAPPPSPGGPAGFGPAGFGPLGGAGSRPATATPGPSWQSMPPGYPPYPYPPVGYPPPGYPPPPRRRGLLRSLLALFLVVGLGLSLLLNFVWLFGGSAGDHDGPVLTQTVVKGDASKTVAVVSLAGEIDGASSVRFRRLIDKVEADPAVHALVVEVDTPGGEVTASDEMYDRLLRYKARRQQANRPATVVIAMKSMATSGGYYVACAGDRIFAEPTTLTGNIGVLMPRFNFSGLMDKYGVKETTVVATGADFKHVGSPFQPDTPEGEAYLRGHIDQAFDRFKAVVSAGRGANITGKNVFNGKVFTAAEAKSLGLVDQVGYPDDAYAFAAGTSGAQVVRYREPSPSLLGILFSGGAASTVAPAQAAGGNAAGGPDVRALLRPETLDAWRTTRVMYR
jgi:protease-4